MQPQTRRAILLGASLGLFVHVYLLGPTTGVRLLHAQTLTIPLLHVVSLDHLNPDDGYVQLIVQDTKRRQVGLSTPTTPLAYSLVVQNGQGTILEGGQIRRTFTAPSGTILKILLHLGAVSYTRNDVPLYASPTPLLVAPIIETYLEDANTVLGRITYCGWQ